MLMPGQDTEKVVNKQLVTYLHINSRLHPVQHGFIAGKSKLTILLQSDKYVTDCLLAVHRYDVISFDFCKAFDKVPHWCVLDAAAKIGVTN